MFYIFMSFYFFVVVSCFGYILADDADWGMKTHKNFVCMYPGMFVGYISEYIPGYMQTKYPGMFVGYISVLTLMLFYKVVEKHLEVAIDYNFYSHQWFI